MRITRILLMLPLLGGEVRAELPPQRCSEEWWEFAYQAPSEVTGLPLEPRVLLPVQWSSRFHVSLTSPTEAALAPGVLTVTVRDSADRPVDGTVGVGLLETDGSWDFRLDRQVWWQPNTLLTPGTYTAEVAVTAPIGDSFAYCYFSSFEATLMFQVTSIPPPVAKLAVQASLDISIGGLFYTNECFNFTDTRTCSDAPGWCCFSADHYVITTSLTPSGLFVGGSAYYALEVRQDRISPPYDDIAKTYQVLGDGVSLTLQQGYVPNLLDLQSWPASRCVTASLRSLTDGNVVATDTRCVDMRPGAEAFPDFACEEDVCVESAGGTPIADEAVVSDPDPADSHQMDSLGSADDGEKQMTATGTGCASGGSHFFVGVSWLVFRILNSACRRPRRRPRPRRRRVDR